MIHNFAGPNINFVLPELLDALTHRGSTVPSRNGDTTELAFTGIMLGNPWQREIVLPGRKANIAAQIAETMWVLAGRNDVEFLSHYLPRAKDFSDDGATWRAGYGPRLRHWSTGDGDDVDQLAEVVRLLRADHDTRRAVMSLWDPALDYVISKDIPCNNWLHFLIRDERLHLHVAIRSNDAMWGWSGINAFEWSALLEIVAGLVGVEVGQLHFAVTSMHLYDRHFDKAVQLSQLAAPEYETGLVDSPRFQPQYGTMTTLNRLIEEWFAAEQLIRQGDVEAAYAVEVFPEPMMRSWLRVLQWWWSGHDGWLDPLGGTRLYEACRVAVQPKLPAPRLQLGEHVIKPQSAPAQSESMEHSRFILDVTQLHDEKHKAYGDSWKRRGEMLGIMANLARKVDRLGANGGGDTAGDTAVDLLVYLAKYRWWLVDFAEAPMPVQVPAGCEGQRWCEDTAAPNYLLLRMDAKYQRVWEDRSRLNLSDPTRLEQQLTDLFASLEELVMERRVERHRLVDEMLPRAYELARQLQG